MISSELARPGHTWTLDTVTFSDRSDEGSKYLCVLRCKATGVFKLIPLYKKSHIREEIAEWIRDMRTHPLFQNLSYPVVSLIETDNAGEWDMRNSDWLELEKSSGFRTKWTSPDRKEELGYGERANGIVEVVIKSILFQNNLPVQFWQACAADAEFILNRLPLASKDVSVTRLSK